MPAPVPESSVVRDQGRGALQAVWEMSGGGYAERLFSSGASVMSGSTGSGPDQDRGQAVRSPQSSVRGVTATAPAAVGTARKAIDAHPFMERAGLKLVIQSPYDCVLAVKRDAADHLEWLVQRER
ncbi:Vacuolar protein sorting-associated protein 41, partial [Teratosphaeriaceae sp. CCFEE 6253]